MDPNHNAFDDSTVPPTVSTHLTSVAKVKGEALPTAVDPITAIVGDTPYRIEAFEFVQEGLRHTVERILRHTHSVHGAAETVGGGTGDDSLHGQHEFDGPHSHLGNLGSTSGSSFDTAAEFNFADADSRHITGQQLCIGLREYAIQRYGMLAPIVLRHWNVLRTEDFGRIVYRLIDVGLMSRTPDDSLSDFVGVYEFDEVFGTAQLAARVGRA